MSQRIDVNGESINYPQTGDTNWGDEATQFAIQTSAALGKIGLSSGTSVDVVSTLDVTGATTLDSTLTVAGTTTLNGTANLNGNTNLGNAITDTVTVTAILNVDSGTLYVDPTNNRIGINKTNPAQALDVVGNSAISGNETVGGTLGVTSDITTSGILTASNSTNVTTAPPITFTGDTNTGIGRSAADTLDFITNGNSRFRIESTGQIKAVYESQVGTDYNTTLNNGYLCRAWVNFNGTGTVTIQASGNVSSITDNNIGNYTVNFTTALPDANYSVSSISAPAIGSSLGVGAWFVGIGVNGSGNVVTKTTSSLGIRSSDNNGGVSIDGSEINVMVFR